LQKNTTKILKTVIQKTSIMAETHHKGFDIDNSGDYVTFLPVIGMCPLFVTPEGGMEYVAHMIDTEEEIQVQEEIQKLRSVLGFTERFSGRRVLTVPRDFPRNGLPDEAELERDARLLLRSTNVTYNGRNILGQEGLYLVELLIQRAPGKDVAPFLGGYFSLLQAAADRLGSGELYNSGVLSFLEEVCTAGKVPSEQKGILQEIPGNTFQRM